MYKLILIMLINISFSVLANKVNIHDELTIALEEFRIESNIPSMAVAIISSGEITYTKGFGFLDVMQTKPATDQSLFRIASISKLFTAQAIMQLADNGKLALNENVGQYLSHLRKSDITIRQLLTHSSGLSDTIKPVSIEKQRSIDAYFALVSKSIPSSIENKDFEYSDTNYNLLGAVISAVTGQKYEKYMYDNILKTASMKKSNYFDGINEHFAEASPNHKGKFIDKIDQRPYDLSFNPSEGLVSNVSDLAQWLRLTLDNDTSIIKEQTYKEMLEPQIKTSWGKIHMGLGWQVYKSEYGNIARHPGSIRGYKSLILTYPDSKDAMILLTNSSNTPRWEIAKLITGILKSNAEW